MLCCAVSMPTPAPAPAPAGDRQGGQEDWRAKLAEQRKVDIETFGGMTRPSGERGGRGGAVLCASNR